MKLDFEATVKPKVLTISEILFGKNKISSSENIDPKSDRM